MELVILLFAMICFYTGYNTGRQINLQYRMPKEASVFVNIPEKYKCLFPFKGISEHPVVKSGVITYVTGLVFSFSELILFITSLFVKRPKTIIGAACITVLLFAVALFCIVIPPWIKYCKYCHVAFDCDWITDLQRAVTVLPKRRCKIVSQIDDSTFLISFGGFKKHTARSNSPVNPGTKLYAIHSYDQDFPFWTLRDH